MWYGVSVPIHPTNTRNADALYLKHAGKLLSPAGFNGENGEQSPTPMKVLLEGTLLDLAAESNLLVNYKALSQTVSKRRLRQKKAQRASLFDIDIGGLGWMTFACSMDDRTSLQKRMVLLQEAHVRVWGHPSLDKPWVREPLIPQAASQLMRKEWQTL